MKERKEEKAEESKEPEFDLQAALKTFVNEPSSEEEEEEEDKQWDKKYMWMADNTSVGLSRAFIFQLAKLGSSE